jgi:hypothetical protein
MILMNLLRLFLFVLCVACDLAVGCSGFRWLEFPFSNCADIRESVSSQATGVLSGAPDPPTAADERGSALVGLLVTLLCLEIRSSYRQVRNPDRLASQGVLAVLEAKVEARETANPAEVAPTD